MEVRWIDITGSTNRYVREEAGVSLAPMTLVAAREQTAARGQRGNSWESAPGENLTFSFYFLPRDIKASSQFAISEAVALAMVATLREYGIEAKVKWPNDIYVVSKKIAGILIENSILGSALSRSIVGVGLNVNQTEFVSDAPNPISMKMLTGKQYDLDEIASVLASNFECYLAMPTTHHDEYMRVLWRGDGREYSFRETASADVFMASIEGVEPTGHLLLSGARRYAFKEVAFIL